MSNSSKIDDLVERDILKALGEDVPPDIDDILGDSKTTNFEGLDELIGSSENENDEVIENEDELVDISDLDILPMDEIESAIETQEEEIKDTELTVDSKSLSYLLNELLNNKTVEITIKVKD
ncbi:MAG: hypothetical protein U9Q30_01465 [Campylobacterota bacterium]|nr:hypothetical protein [Campylobacterota bacterium]